MIEKTMGEKQRAPGHHASAIYHHGQAARHHPEVSRHLQADKDYAHAAHVGPPAHSYATRALWYRNETQAEDDSLHAGYPTSSTPTFDNALSKPGTAKAAFDTPARHAAAASDHEHAAKHQAYGPSSTAIKAT
jgi:hypothetical protein